MKWIIIFTLLALSANAYTISDYPTFFAKNGTFKAIYVISDESPALDVVSATVISTALAKYNLTTEVGTSRVDSEVTDITRHNAIIIANPCESNAALKLEGNPSPCHKNLAGSAGYIKLFENNGNVQILITGITAEDRHKAAKFLANSKLDQLKLKTYILSTGTNSKPPYFEQFNQTKNASSNTTAAQNLTIPPPVEIKNETNATLKNTSSKTINTSKPKPPVGKYEPMTTLPKKKTIWERFTGWLKSLFW